MTITDSFREMPFFDFLYETGQDTDGYSEAKLGQLGNEYYVKVSVEGLRNKSPEIVWTLRGDVADLPIKERKQWIHQFLATFTPPADSYARTAKVWIQYPPFHGKFFAVIEIDYPENESLAAIHTSSFTGRETQPRERPAPTAVTRTITTVTTIPAITTLMATTVDATITTDTSTIATTSTATIATTIPAATSTVTSTTTQTLQTTVPAHVPIVRPKAKIESP